MIYILLPAYNEAENIRSLLQTIDAEALSWATDKQIEEHPSGVHAVVVNDGSTDATEREALTYSGTVTTTVISHETNRGLAAALYTGIVFILERCRDNDWVVTLDADGTHHPRYIFQIADRLACGYDIVVASRYAQGGREVGVRWYRKWLSHGARTCYRVVFPRWPIHDFSCGFRGMQASILRNTLNRWNDKLFEMPGFTCTGELMLKMLEFTTTDRVTEIPFELHYEKKGGKSKMPAFKTILGTLRLIRRAKKWFR